jgi:RNA polymerase sigma-70 factor (ECF subfamily)
VVSIAPDGRYRDDLTLTRAVAKGDRRACERFARRLLPTVRRVTRQLLHGTDDAKDAAQVSLMELLNSASNYAGRGPLEGWARRIATRSTLRLMKRTRTRERKLAQAHESAIHNQHGVLETEVLDRLPRPIDDYLDLLSEVQRTAVLLRFVLGHTIPEISELTGAPIPTVKSRIQKGHQDLRRLVRRDLNLGVRRPDSDPEE